MPYREKEERHWTFNLIAILLVVLLIVVIGGDEMFNKIGNWFEEPASSDKKELVEKTPDNSNNSLEEEIEPDAENQAEDVLPATERETAETAEAIAEPRENKSAEADIPSFNAGGENVEEYVEKADEQVYEIVDMMPTYPGGPAALMRYLSENVKYPSVAKNEGIQGRVTVGFVVMKDGTIANVHVKKSVEPSLDREAERVVRSMPKWKPGRNGGKPVNVRYFVPVVFRIR